MSWGAAQTATTVNNSARKMSSYKHRASDGCVSNMQQIRNRIFVGGITPDIMEEDLHELFQKYGAVKSAKIIIDRSSTTKGYGFVTFEAEETAQTILNSTTNVVWHSKRLNVASAYRRVPGNGHGPYFGGVYSQQRRSFGISNSSVDSPKLLPQRQDSTPSLGPVPLKPKSVSPPLEKSLSVWNEFSHSPASFYGAQRGGKVDGTNSSNGSGAAAAAATATGGGSSGSSGGGMPYFTASTPEWLLCRDANNVLWALPAAAAVEIPSYYHSYAGIPSLIFPQLNCARGAQSYTIDNIVPVFGTTNLPEITGCPGVGVPDDFAAAPMMENCDLIA